MVNSKQEVTISTPCILDFSAVDMPQCQYQPVYIIMSISRPSLMTLENMPPTCNIMLPSDPIGPLGPMGASGNTIFGSWVAHFQCPSARGVIIFRYMIEIQFQVLLSLQKYTDGQEASVDQGEHKEDNDLALLFCSATQIPGLRLND